MADEEISPAQKLAIATNFIINSPPAQVGNVLEGARRDARDTHAPEMP